MQDGLPPIPPVDTASVIANHSGNFNVVPPGYKVSVFANLFVTPSYMVTMLDRLDIRDNGEPTDCFGDVDPSEMSFTFFSCG